MGAHAMNIFYEILLDPQDDFFVSLEGRFVIEIDGSKQFDDSFILLTELAVFFRKWLDGDPRQTEFSFDSMDEEETGLLTIEPTDNGTFKLSGAWSEFDAVVAKDEVISAITDYLIRLRDECRERYGTEWDWTALPV